MSHRNKIIFSVLVTFIAFPILYLLLPGDQRNYLNTISIIGFLLSVLGIAIAYFQILSLKEIAKITQDEVIRSIKLNNTLLMISDLSRKAAMVDEIQSFLRQDKIELCILRMKDLKLILNSVKNHEHYGSLFSKKEFKTVFEDFNIDLDNFQKHHLSNRNALDKGKIIANLEVLSTFLLSLEVKFKRVNHDTR